MSAMLVAVPLGLAAAVSPVMLAEQTVLVAGAGGRRAGCWYAEGTVVVLVALCAVVDLLGRSVSLPRAPHLDATLDIVLGAVLLLLGLVARGTRRTGEPGRDDARAHREGRSAGPRPLAAFGFGLFSMATNLTTLTIVLVAAKDIAASRSSCRCTWRPS